MIQVAVMGYGTIGSGVVEVLETNREIIKKKDRSGYFGKIHSGSA